MKNREILTFGASLQLGPLASCLSCPGSACFSCSNCLGSPLFSGRYDYDVRRFFFIACSSPIASKLVVFLSDTGLLRDRP